MKASISDWPPEAVDSAVPRHRDGDLLAVVITIAILVERTLLHDTSALEHLNGKDTVSVVQATTHEMIKLPINLRKIPTWDRGVEITKHTSLSIAPLNTQSIFYYIALHLKLCILST